MSPAWWSTPHSIANVRPLLAVWAVLFEAGHVGAEGVADETVLADPEVLLLAVLDCVLDELGVAEEVPDDGPSPSKRAPKTPPFATAGPSTLFR